MTMTPTRLARWLGTQLGVTHSHLEVSLSSLLEIVRTNALPIFSHYFPYMRRIDLNFQSEEVKTNKKTQFRIPPTIIKPERIMKVADVITLTQYGNIYPYAPNMNTDIITEQLSRNIVSGYMQTVTWSFTPPNLINVYPGIYYGKMAVELHMKHDVNFFTIPTTLELEFQKLALLECKEFIFNIRKNYRNIATAFGTLELDIDTFQSAADEKKELLELWKNNYWKEGYRKKVWIG